MSGRARWLVAAAALLLAAAAAAAWRLEREKRRAAEAEAAARRQRAAAHLAEGRAEAARDQWQRALALYQAARREEESPAARLSEEIARREAAERGASWRGRADAVGFGTGGEALAAVIDGAAIRLVELSGGREQRRLACDLPPVSVEIGRAQPDGGFGIDALVVARVQGGGLRAFSLQSGEQVAALELPPEALAAPGAGGRELVLWDRGLVIAPVGGGPRERLGGEDGDPAVQLAATPGMAHLLRRSGRLETWMLAGRRLVSVAEGVRAPLAVSAAGKVSAGEGGALLLRREGGADVLGVPQAPASLLALDGGRGTLASAPEGPGPIELWSATERRRAQVLPAPEGGVRRLAISDDGRLLIAAGPAAAESWSLPVRLRSERLAAGPLRGLAFAPSGLLVEADAGSLAVDAIDATGPIRRGSVLAPAPAQPGRPQLAVSAGGLQLAVAAADGAHVVTLGSAGALGFAARLADGQGGVALSADGARLFTAAPGRLQAFEVRTERRLWEAQRSCAPIAFAAFDGGPGGGELLCAGPEGLLRLDPATGAERGRLEAPGAVEALALSPDGVVAAAAGEGVRLLALGSRAPPAPLLALGAPATAIAFSADGALLAAGTAGGALQLWDARSGAHLADYPRFAGAVTQAWFSPTGVALIAASSGAPGARFVAVPEWLGRRGVTP